ncbi:MAG: hypothetical protein A4E37_00329 [Methanoregulaceae archaeon PtaB.Bin056]|nr:MAG: hypothetical protein A4E37_00329 [Methanoregulaceae archaeon PtaB.Bin056]
MEKNQIILVVLGLVACGALYFLVDIYASLIGVVLVIALAMSFFIMQDSAMTPDVSVRMKEDGRGIVVRNRGNARAVSILLTLMPQEIKYHVPSLDEDAEKTLSSDQMIERTTVKARYQNEQGRAYEKRMEISVFDKPDEDLLKPVFPLFKWK